MTGKKSDLVARLQEGISSQQNMSKDAKRWETETVDTLKTQCRYRGLASGGKKQLLVERLTESAGPSVVLLKRPLSSTQTPSEAPSELPEETSDGDEYLQETADPALPSDYTDDTDPGAEPELDLSQFK